MKQLAQNHTASVQQHQDLFLGVYGSRVYALFTTPGHHVSLSSAVADTGPGIFGDMELYSARSLSSKSPSHVVTSCTEMVTDSPVPNQQESLSPSFHKCSRSIPTAWAKTQGESGSLPWDHVGMWLHPKPGC